jgi:FAD/FMN-containing dehydrogenase
LTYIGVIRRNPHDDHNSARRCDPCRAAIDSHWSSDRTWDQDYEAARRTWNYAIDQYPEVIVRCTGTADVVAAVRFARSEGLPIAVRGGKHSIAGFSTCDDGLVVDLTQMCAVNVDARAGRSRAQVRDVETVRALRGGGGNFGVVTSLEFAVHQVGPDRPRGPYFLSGGPGAQVISGWVEAVAEAPDELTSFIDLTAAPPLPFLPEAIHGSKVASS